MAWNSETNQISFYRVTNAIHHTDKTIVKLSIGDETLTTTPEHPFYVEGKGWVYAKDLKVGDAIRKADGSTGKVRRIQIEQSTQEMYNLTVDQAHTFFVGKGQWLVHNTCEEAFDDLAQKREELGLEDTDVLARLDINGESIYGTNGPGVTYPRPPGVTFQSLRHAEGDAFGQAIASGMQSDSATLYVDTMPCRFCTNSFAGYARALGLDELEVYTPDGLYGFYDAISDKFLLAP